MEDRGRRIGRGRRRKGWKAVSGDEVSLLEIREALERIEEKVEDETHTAFVVDTAGGDLLLRLEDMGPEDLNLEHGGVVEVSVSKVDASVT